MGQVTQTQESGPGDSLEEGGVVGEGASPPG